MVEAISLRTWTETDIDYVTKSVTREGWGHTRRDIERCWRWEPGGCFIAELGLSPVGHVSTIRYDSLGWVGLLIVNPDKRGKGVGSKLMRRAIGYLTQTGAETIRLEAEEKAVPLYRSLGFAEEFDSLRFSGRKKLLRIGLAGEVRPMQAVDVERILPLDYAYFGAARDRVLKKLFEDDPSYCFVAYRDQRPVGYIMGRNVQDALRIGPYVCEDPSLSAGLLDACVRSVKEENTEMLVGFPSANEAMLRLANQKGFKFTGKCVRMVFGGRRHQGIPQCVYGLAGAEKG